jgi:aconitate hydratase
MSPEYGATIAICPIDDMTLDYLRLTARDEPHVQMVEAYAKDRDCSERRIQSTRFTPRRSSSIFHRRTSLAGPKRPQDRVSLRQSKTKFQQALDVMLTERKPNPQPKSPERSARLRRSQPRPQSRPKWFPGWRDSTTARSSSPRSRAARTRRTRA